MRYRKNSLLRQELRRSLALLALLSLLALPALAAGPQDKNEIAALMQEASGAVARANYTQAIHIYHRVLELDPAHIPARLQIARVLSWSRNYADSVKQYDTVLAQDPSQLEARLEKARVLSWEKEFDVSLAEYGRVVETLQAGGTGAERLPALRDIRFEYARVLSWARRYDEAMAQFELLLPRGAELQPHDLPVLVERGRVLSWQHRFDEANADFDQALALAPGNREARLGRAQTLLWSGKARHAKPLLMDLYREQPQDAAVLLSLASAESQAGRPDRALNLLDTAVALAPGDADTQNLRNEIRSHMRPELRLNWNYGRDIDRLNFWRYGSEVRFNLTPRMRNFVSVDYLPSSGPATSFGYRVFALPGQGACPVSSLSGCTFFAAQVPNDPFVPGTGLLDISAFPGSVLLDGGDRVHQSAVQVRFGGQMQVNEWLRWSGSIGTVTLRHGNLAGGVPGFPATETRLVYSIAPTFIVAPRLELTVAAAREYVPYTPKALAQGTHYDELNVMAVWLPTPRTRLSVNSFGRWFAPLFFVPADGTFPGGTAQLRGWGGGWSATRALARGERGEFEVGYDGTAFTYTRPSGLTDPHFIVNPGLFAPSFYQRHAALVRGAWKPNQFVTWDLHGTLGGQQVFRRSDFSLSASAGSRLDLRLSRAATLSFSYDYFNSAGFLQTLVAPATARGYHSHAVGTTLYIRF